MELCSRHLETADTCDGICTCGHDCFDHYFFIDECAVDGCECGEYIDVDEEAPYLEDNEE